MDSLLKCDDSIMAHDLDLLLIMFHLTLHTVYFSSEQRHCDWSQLPTESRRRAALPKGCHHVMIGCQFLSLYSLLQRSFSFVFVINCCRFTAYTRDSTGLWLLRLQDTAEAVAQAHKAGAECGLLSSSQSSRALPLWAPRALAACGTVLHHHGAMRGARGTIIT